MGYNRARRDDFMPSGLINRNSYKKGGDIDHWMQDVHPKKGALHRELHIPMDQKIPTSVLKKNAHSPNKLLNKRANLALRYRGQ